MEHHPPHPKQQPVGTTLIHLKNIPPNQLATAARHCMRHAKTPGEHMRYLELWHNPGSTSGRIAT